MTVRYPLVLAIIGDIHDQWDATDSKLLLGLGVDFALFVGDFGNESVEVVREISTIALPKAVVLGNHDAWYSASVWGRQRCPYDRAREDRVDQQLDLLGDAHVGYGRIDLPDHNISVVGSRPFSWGGPDWKNARFYRDRYGISGFASSCARIVGSAAASPYDTAIFLAHNGPTGLGTSPHSICGRDWKPGGGDYGDADLANAIAKARTLGKTVPLVAFGHMHHRLRHTRAHLRTAVVKDRAGTVYLNAARSPRHHVTPDGRTQRHFTRVELTPTGVREISAIWLLAEGAIARKQVLYRRQLAALPEQEPSR
ncbi:calcineurin-like phosphoesterase [Rubidibacter lacunae KORDI 51-2]|uniref:Calcineurin-like phosphoesterase n=1 Tax=Rubidibacter lacunae KORDI 51-2 TaxID=582515 RepID=U5DKE8_9CHRO|nr:TIGR04168 family protein [Rubidibacter lacunae]ERN42141.1 calcineurin-like phosphoesterase [Rubidibacter lacunae KORDI 51-2]